jgi:hypothetical protein
MRLSNGFKTGVKQNSSKEKAGGRRVSMYIEEETLKWKNQGIFQYL